MRQAKFLTSDLKLIAPAPPPDNPPLTIGDRCQLNSGSPSLLVVDVNGDDITVSWRKDFGVVERIFPRACVRRLSANLRRVG